MDKWFRMDLLHNISGPYDWERIKEFAREGLNFRVALPDAKDWLPVERIGWSGASTS